MKDAERVGLSRVACSVVHWGDEMAVQKVGERVELKAAEWAACWVELWVAC